MKILFTGASSFTGYWFVRTLVEAGHEVACTFTRTAIEDYDGDVRGDRVRQLVDLMRPVWGCSFGNDLFLRQISDFRPDVLCHHAADVTDYKSADFDYLRALECNTHRIRDVLRILKDVGCQRIVLTGSVFEAGEGAGSDGLPNFSPYGLSKSLTAAAFSFYCRVAQMSLGKFVIPNPFGPWEDPRFTGYLVRCWRAGEVAMVRTPDYVRDNIHVSLLASAYREFVTQVPTQSTFVRFNPSGYTETQQDFAERFAQELRSRTGWKCELGFSQQSDLSEPLVRVNTDRVDGLSLGWDESAAWDELANYYRSTAVTRS